MGVAGFELTNRAPVAGGAVFGDVGPYEELTGIVRLSLDPAAEANQWITDLDLAHRDAERRVRFSADLVVMAPLEHAARTDRLLFDVPNRGRHSAARWMNSSAGYPQPTITDVGNGFLMRHGFTVARCGWQQDLPDEPGRIHLHGPQLRADAAETEGLVLCQFQTDVVSSSLELSHRSHRAYPTRDLHDPDARLTVRAHDGLPRQVVARKRWRFARSVDGAPVDDPEHIWIEGGFQPGLIYEVVYTAHGPSIVGLGLIAIRDVAAWLRFGTASEGNPFPDTFSYALAHGESQSGRFLREFLYRGLNADEKGREVFGGLLLWVPGARRGEFNTRFGQPSKTTAEDYGARFPFHDRTLAEPAAGDTDGLMNRLHEIGRVPKVITVNASTEYWGGDRGAGGQASLLHTDPFATKDVAPDENSRVYALAGAQHVPQKWPTGSVTHLGTRCQQLICSLDHRPISRALLLALDTWVRSGREPPPSRVPSIADGNAISPQAAIDQLTAIPGFAVPAHLPRLHSLDFGPDPETPCRLPPDLGVDYNHFVSSLDNDGNEVAGIRHPDVVVPLATYTGVNVRHNDAGGPGTLVPAAGGMYPFAAARKARLASGDRRLSIAERYEDERHYLAGVMAAAEELLKQGFLLYEDVDRVIGEAKVKYRALAGHDTVPPERATAQ